MVPHVKYSSWIQISTISYHRFNKCMFAKVIFIIASDCNGSIFKWWLSFNKKRGSKCESETLLDDSLDWHLAKVSHLPQYFVRSQPSCWEGQAESNIRYTLCTELSIKMRKKRSLKDLLPVARFSLCNSENVFIRKARAASGVKGVSDIREKVARLVWVKRKKKNGTEDTNPIKMMRLAEGNHTGCHFS